MKKKSFCRLLRLIPLPLLAAPLFFASCSSDDSMTPIDEVKTPQRPISVEVSETPFGNTTEARQLTRAAITDLTSFNSFEMTANNPTKDHYEVTKNGSWGVDGFWPDGVDANTPVTFYAYSDGTYNDNSGTPYINFTVDENAAYQKDLLVSTASGTWGATQGNLSFTFDHACTALRFYVKKANNLNDYTLSITNVQLCNVINMGNYYYGTKLWTLGDTRSYYTLYTGSKTLGTTNYEALDKSDAPYLFMIPQELTPWDGTTDIASATTQTYIQLTCTITGATSFTGTAYIPFAGTFVQGNLQDVKINIGKNSLYSSDNTKIFN